MTDYEPVRVAEPDELPVSRSLMKSHLHVDHTDDDTLIDIYLGAATTHLDGPRGMLRRAIVTQSWSQQFDAFARSLRLGLAPIVEIESVVYLDTAGDEQAVAAENYQLLNPQGSPSLRFVDDYSWPATQDQRPVLTVTFVAGYGDASEVPPPLKAAIMLMVGDMYQRREASIDGSVAPNPTVDLLIRPYRPPGIA